MPTENFYRLSEIKQQSIINAVKMEITRAPYEEFSIYNVVQHCDISRGSFYQYFYSKDDVFIYLMSEYNNTIIDCVRNSLKTHDGDFFIALEEGFRCGVSMFCYKDNTDYRQHLFCHVKFYEKIWKDDEFSAEKHPALHETLFLINRQKLNFIHNEEDLRILIQICMATVTRECVRLLMTKTDEETICESFMCKLNLLKHAYLKANT